MPIPNVARARYEVLELMVGGLTNAAIAERWAVSPRTAEHHVPAGVRKLGVITQRDAGPANLPSWD
jgi:DNA-binding NarL/FixJ family response regulator